MHDYRIAKKSTATNLKFAYLISKETSKIRSYI